MNLIDLRSDTTTLPSPAMRQAMGSAELGDDVLGEDPTVNSLQEQVADRLGKQASLFVSSGTMGNLVGILLHASRGDEVIVEADAHVFCSEAAGLATVGGVQLRPVAASRGVFRADQLENAMRPPDDDHQPRTAAVAIENTHNRHGGTVWSLGDLQMVKAFAQEHSIAVHLDGARLFNASIASGTPVKQIAACADTVTFCFSKGLGCPAGSMIAGSAETIRAARRWRKLLGGGMRQVGVLAAAGLYALEHMVDRLEDDHVNAKLIAQEIASLDGISLDLSTVQSNIVCFDLDHVTADAFLRCCAEAGLLGLPRGDRSVRFVTHFGVEEADAKSVPEIVARALKAAAG